MIDKKSFLEEYTSVEGKSIIVRCSSPEKAKDVKEILEEVTTSDRVKTFQSEEGGGTMQKLKEGFEGVQKGVVEGQKALGTAGERIGGMAEAPEGGMLQSMYGGNEQVKKEIAVFESGKKAREGKKSMEDNGVPEKAMSIEGKRLIVRCSSSEKQYKVHQWLEDLNPVDILSY